MTDRERVIDILERCIKVPADCEGCPNSDEWCGGELIEIPKMIMRAAIKLLKAQQPRVMTLEEANDADVVRVIRCKDCKWWWAKNELCVYQIHLSGKMCCLECSAEDYCSHGERGKDDAHELIKAEKKKAKVVFKQYEQYDGSIESECGNCGQHLDKAYSHCPKCNKELDWNGG